MAVLIFGPHIRVLFLDVVVPIFIFTLVICVRDPMLRKKWMWVAFKFLGVGAIQVNWASGAYGLQLLSVHLFGASATFAGPAAPWVISASMPLGACSGLSEESLFLQSVEENKSMNSTTVTSAV